MSYASPTDLAQYGLTPQALANFTLAQQQGALNGASATADGYLRSRYTLPLRSWDLDLRRNVCMLAAYDLMVMVGFNPEGDDTNLRLRAEDALRWLKQVSEGVVTIHVEESAPVIPSPLIQTGAKRGW